MIHNLSESDLHNALKEHDELNIWWRSLTLTEKSWVRSRWGVQGRMARQNVPAKFIEHNVTVDESLPFQEPVTYPGIIPMESGLGIKEKPSGRKKTE